MHQNSSKIKEAIQHPSLALDFLKNQIDRQISRTLLGNSAGLSNNFKGYVAKLNTKKLNFDQLKHTSGYELGSKLYTNGHINLGNIYESELINRISTRFNELIDDDQHSFVRAKRENQIFSRALYRPGEQIPESLKLINNKIISVLESYYKSHFKITHFSFFRNHHVPTHLVDRADVINNRWHCDPLNTSWVKLFIYFTDVTKKDGPFNVQTMERTKELMKMGYKTRFTYNLPDEIIEDENHIWRATGKQGFAIMCNCNLGLHKAGIPEPGHFRDNISIQFAPSSEPLTKDWYSKFIDSYEKIWQNRSQNQDIPVPD